MAIDDVNIPRPVVSMLWIDGIGADRTYNISKFIVTIGGLSIVDYPLIRHEMLSRSIVSPLNKRG